MEKGPLSWYNYKGCDSSFNDHSTRRQHEDGHSHEPRHRCTCTCGKTSEYLATLLFSVWWCWARVGLQYRKLSCLACWVPWFWPLLLLNLDCISPNDLRHRCHVWCYLQPELVLLVFHQNGNVYAFPPVRSIWWLQFTDRPWQEQLLQSNSQNSSCFTSFSTYGLRLPWNLGFVDGQSAERARLTSPFSAMCFVFWCY